MTEWLAESLQMKAGILFALERFEEARATLQEFLPTFQNAADTDPIVCLNRDYSSNT